MYYKCFPGFVKRKKLKILFFFCIPVRNVPLPKGICKID